MAENPGTSTPSTLQTWWSTRTRDVVHTVKKEKKIFLIYKEIQVGAVAKSYMWKGFLINEEMDKYLVIQYIRRPLVIYDLATARFWVSLYMRKILFSFLSVHTPPQTISVKKTEKLHSLTAG